ncbi:hypothetical protein A3I34_00930 [Candidatus Jorgensenbacteria bacterium RIFCSPLOWO2_02_FULL_45_12]|nr:MAG: hypothetical protein A3I34_00930 [Candidatus Jorgensenbacteria bacterium RIFCSPLOWO2_02_FULL_45_12]
MSPKRTFTHKLSFSNTNQSILDIVEDILLKKNISLYRDTKRIAISRKKDINTIIDFIQFRKYK